MELKNILIDFEVKNFMNTVFWKLFYEWSFLCKENQRSLLQWRQNTEERAECAEIKTKPPSRSGAVMPTAEEESIKKLIKVME